ncbi:MAG: hypothetical protein D6808_05045 [Candidatus Dadabacteria bacterium]|nr:MAG: hypothetical protein D6808_05045 [Candidatus Dadabacteria bacterium]
MAKNKTSKACMLQLGFALVFTLLLAAIYGCGSTDGGSKDFSGSQFVADSSVGTITLSAPSSIAVSKTGGFSVRVRDGSGSAVPQIKVACDTEKGLALIEPTTGVELTDGTGNMSGVVGCERPGSFQIGCRLPIGAAKRQFRTVKCTGDIPDGFTGFPGAGGGGLGGGVQISDDAGPGGTNTNGISITDFQVIDDEVEGLFVIDTTQVNNCGDSGTDAEPFGDATFSVDFLNETNSTITITNYTMRVPGVGTFGPIGIGSSVSGGVAPNGGEQTVTGLIAAAQADGTKTYAGSSTTISSSTGFKNVVFTFSGHNDQGDKVSISIKVGITFSNANRCTSGGGSSGETGSVTVTSLSFADNGTSGTSADVTATSCSAGESETIGDTTFTMTVSNGTGGAITLSQYTVTIAGLDTSTVQQVGQLATGTATFSGLVAVGVSAGSSEEKQTIAGTTIGEIGVTAVTITLTGVDKDNNAVTITATGSVNFKEIDNCS